MHATVHTALLVVSVACFVLNLVLPSPRKVDLVSLGLASGFALFLF